MCFHSQVRSLNIGNLKSKPAHRIRQNLEVRGSCQSSRLSMAWAYLFFRTYSSLLSHICDFCKNKIFASYVFLLFLARMRDLVLPTPSWMRNSCIPSFFDVLYYLTFLRNYHYVWLLSFAPSKRSENVGSLPFYINACFMQRRRFTSGCFIHLSATCWTPTTQDLFCTWLQM